MAEERYQPGQKSQHFDAFLKLTNVKGESVDAKHKDEIEILAWSWDVKQPHDNRSTGMAIGRVQVGNLEITKQADKSTPALYKSVCCGDHIGDGLLTVRKAGGDNAVEYIKMKMTDVFVTSIDAYTHEDSPALLEKVSLNFKTFTITYTSQGKDGSAGPGGDFGYDLHQHKKL